MPNPTLHSTADPASRTERVSGLTPKGLLTVQLIRLNQLIDQLTDAERLDLVVELAPFVRCARARVESRTESGDPPLSASAIA